MATGLQGDGPVWLMADWGDSMSASCTVRPVVCEHAQFMEVVL